MLAEGAAIVHPELQGALQTPEDSEDLDAEVLGRTSLQAFVRAYGSTCPRNAAATPGEAPWEGTQYVA